MAASYDNATRTAKMKRALLSSLNSTRITAMGGAPFTLAHLIFCKMAGDRVREGHPNSKT